MTTNFKKIFSLSVSHSYFGKNLCKELQYTTAGTTLLLAKRYNFKLRIYPDGFEWYADTTQDVNDFLNSIKQTSGQDYFEFNIQAPDNFYSYTNLHHTINYQQVYSSNNTVKDNGNANLQPVQQPATNNYFGRLIIYFEDIIEKVTSCNFTINFEAKATQWQYYIVNRSNTNTDDNLLINGTQDINFDGPKEVIIASGEKAKLFTSGNTLIPLSQNPVHVFNLIKTGSSSTLNSKPKVKVIYKGLPNPNPAFIAYAAGKPNSALASPMFVYI